jgi:predicted Zn-dependent peptidase
MTTGHRQQSAIAQFSRVLLILLFSLQSLLGSPALAAPLPSAVPPPLGGGDPETIAPYLNAVAERVNTFTLQNGMKFIVLERHNAPIVSFLTYADVGATDEPDGQTGVAHYLEHLAFKGTQHIGTRDYPAEQSILAEQDKVFAELHKAQAAGNSAQVAQLQEKLNILETQANQYVVQNQYGQVVNQSGGVGLNATTSADATQYFYSFPSNKLELWMSLESERFLEPVFREFFKEKDVILEERRMRIDNTPVGQLIEVFLDRAFTTHPYRRPVIGYEKDLRDMTRPNVQQFFQTYYSPTNLTIGIVGDVDPVQVKQLAQVYFGRFPKRPAPPKLNRVEPAQTEPREVEVRLPTQPWYIEGYHRPALTDPDDVVYQLMASILSDGRTSRLYQHLVQEQQVALSAQGYNGFPGDKYPNLMMFYALTAQGHSLSELEAALHGEIEALRQELVASEELERVKNQARVSLLRALDSNSGMARLLVSYDVKTGDWRNLFSEIDRLEAVTAEDIRRVAQKTFTPENRTVGRLIAAN